MIRGTGEIVGQTLLSTSPSLLHGLAPGRSFQADAALAEWTAGGFAGAAYFEARNPHGAEDFNPDAAQGPRSGAHNPSTFERTS